MVGKGAPELGPTRDEMKIRHDFFFFFFFPSSFWEMILHDLEERVVLAPCIGTKIGTLPPKTWDLSQGD